MTTRRKSFIEYAALFGQIIVVVLVLGYVLVYLFIALSRLNYPFELEWMEGGSIEHIRRVLSGQPIYTAPSLTFTPFNYSPLYWWVSAGVAAVAGVGFLPLRLVSIVSSLVIFLFIYLIVQRETQRIFPGLVSTGIFAATYRASGAWFDVGRVDSLFLALLLIAIYLIRHHKSRAGFILAGLCIGASFLTKQIAIFMLAPIMLHSLVVARRQSFWLWMTTGIMIVGSTVVLMVTTQGWYQFYTYDLLRSEGTFPAMYTAFWWHDLGLFVPLAILLALVYLIAISKTNWRDSLFWDALFIGMIGGTFVSRIHFGGFDNVLMPAYAVIAILAGLGIHWFFVQARELPVYKQAIISLIVSFLCAGQLVLLNYNPVAQIPTLTDVRNGQALVDQIRSVKGLVFVPSHGYLAVMAGKPFFAHAITIWSVSTNDSPASQALADEIAQAFRQQRFAAVFTDPKWTTPELETYYVPQQIKYIKPDAFFPVTGARTRPEIMWVPRSVIAQPEEF